MSLALSERSYLKGIVHILNPIVNIGKQGVTKGLIYCTNEALKSHELIKIKFTEFKDQKKMLAEEIANQTGSEIITIIGNNLILFKQNDNESDRKIILS